MNTAFRRIVVAAMALAIGAGLAISRPLSPYVQAADSTPTPPGIQTNSEPGGNGGGGGG